MRALGSALLLALTMLMLGSISQGQVLTGETSYEAATRRLLNVPAETAPLTAALRSEFEWMTYDFVVLGWLGLSDHLPADRRDKLLTTWPETNPSPTDVMRAIDEDHESMTQLCDPQSRDYLDCMDFCVDHSLLSSKYTLYALLSRDLEDAELRPYAEDLSRAFAIELLNLYANHQRHRYVELRFLKRALTGPLDRGQLHKITDIDNQIIKVYENEMRAVLSPLVSSDLQTRLKRLEAHRSQMDNTAAGSADFLARLMGSQSIAGMCVSLFADSLKEPKFTDSLSQWLGESGEARYLNDSLLSVLRRLQLLDEPA